MYREEVLVLCRHERKVCRQEERATQERTRKEARNDWCGEPADDSPAAVDMQWLSGKRHLTQPGYCRYYVFGNSCLLGECVHAGTRSGDSALSILDCCLT